MLFYKPHYESPFNVFKVFGADPAYHTVHRIHVGKPFFEYPQIIVCEVIFLPVLVKRIAGRFFEHKHGYASGYNFREFIVTPLPFIRQ